MNIKQLFAFAAILLLLFVAGCGGKTNETQVVTSQPTEPVAPAQPAVQNPAQQQTVSPPEETTEEPALQNTKEMTTLLAKHSKVKSIHYFYQDEKNYPEFHEYSVKGDKMAIKYTVLDQDNAVGKIDTIYMDTSAKKAVAYCERASKTACSDPNNEYPLTYSTYIRETPLDWIEKVTYAERQSQAQLDGRNAIIIKTTIDGKEAEMWLDDYYGLPLQINIDGKTYRFQDLSANSVDDEDLGHHAITV
ncbi:MAG: hypothetical protein KJ574_00950 [Nanoarchaeota archaeon]|nr:hypothetical protein [Nanoarchaeota archaeon]